MTNPEKESIVSSMLRQYQAEPDIEHPQESETNDINFEELEQACEKAEGRYTLNSTAVPNLD